MKAKTLPQTKQFRTDRHAFEAPAGAQLCTWCGQERSATTSDWIKTSYYGGYEMVERPMHYKLPAGWLKIEDAPKDCTRIRVILENGKTLIAHWAQDLSGEDQPPFKGWFDLGYRQIDEPVGWKPLSADLTTR